MRQVVFLFIVQSPFPAITLPKSRLSFFLRVMSPVFLQWSPSFSTHHFLILAFIILASGKLLLIKLCCMPIFLCDASAGETACYISQLQRSSAQPVTAHSAWGRIGFQTSTWNHETRREYRVRKLPMTWRSLDL